MENEVYTVYTDAGSRGNPGKAASAAILLNWKGLLVDLNAGYLGITTNNIAEYEGLIMGLKLALKHKCRKLQVYMDSQLVVKQVKGEYRVKDEKMRRKHAEVTELLKQFAQVNFEHVLRAKNASADKLVNIILDTTA